MLKPTPIAVTAVAGVVVVGFVFGGAVIYFFMSNKAGEQREEYMREVNKVLDLLTRKAEKLVERVQELEREAREARQEKKRLEAELAATKQELEILKAEAANWQQAGLADSLTSRVALVRNSPVLSTVQYRPRKALQHLKEREHELKEDLGELD